MENLTPPARVGKRSLRFYPLLNVRMCGIDRPWSTQCNPPEVIGGAPSRSGAASFSLP